MPISDTLVAVAAVPADTIMGRRCVVSHIPTGGTQINIRGKMAGWNRTVEKAKRRAPNADNEAVTDRTDVIYGEDVLRITLDEFGDDVRTNFMNQISSDGVWKVWIVDPKDATGVARLVSDEFSGQGNIEGEAQFQDGQYAEQVLVIDPSGIIQWRRNVTVT